MQYMIPGQGWAIDTGSGQYSVPGQGFFLDSGSVSSGGGGGGGSTTATHRSFPTALRAYPVDGSRTFPRA